MILRLRRAGYDRNVNNDGHYHFYTGWFSGGGDNMTGLQDYRIEQRIKNNLLYSAIFSAGYKSVADFCRKHNLYPTTVIALINMKMSALDKNGNWRPIVENISISLKIPVEQLFNENQRVAKLKTNTAVQIVSDEALQHHLLESHNQHHPLTMIEAKQTTKTITEQIETLTDREQKAINMYYGLGDYDETSSCREVGVALGVTGGRAQQIINKAIRKLKQPKRANKLREACFDQ